MFSGGGGGERAAGTRTGETKGERSPGCKYGLSFLETLNGMDAQ